MVETPALMAHLAPALMAVAAYIALHHLWLWTALRTEPLYLWVVAWSANTLLFLGSHYLQMTAATPAAAALGIRLAWLAALVMIVAVIGLAHAVGGERPPPRLLVGAAGLNAVLVVLMWLTGLFLSDRAYVRTDLLGGQSPGLVTGPLMPLLVPYILLAFAYVFRTLWRAPALAPAERRWLLGGFSVYVLFAVNDLLHAARLIQSVRVFDLAFVAVGAGLTYLLVRRHARLHHHLQEEVGARTLDLARREERQAGLVRAGQTVMAGLDLPQALGRILEEAGRIARTPHVKVLLLDEGARTLRLAAAGGGSVPVGFEVPMGTSYSGRVATSGQPLFVADTQNDPENLLADRDRREGIRTFLGLPIRFGEQVLGVLTLNTEAPSRWQPDELAALSSFADQAAIAIHNARLHAQVAERSRRLAALATLSRSLTATLALEEVLDRVVRSAVELFGSSTGRLWLVDEADPATLVLLAHAGAETAFVGLTRMPVGQGLVGRVAAERAPLVVEDLQAESRALNVRRQQVEGLVSFAGVPLLHGERVLGALGVATRERRRFAREDLEILQSLASHAAVAIENARLYEAARSQARELAALDEVRTALVSTLELGRVLETIAEWAMRLTGAEGSLVRELDDRDGLLHVRTGRGIRAGRPEFPLRLGQGAQGAAALRREPVWNTDVLAQELPGYGEEMPGSGRLMREVIRERGYRAVLALPMVSRDTLFGSLAVYWAEPHAPTGREIRLLEAFAQQAAVAVEHARLYAAARARVEHLETLARLNRLISSSLARDRVLAEICRSAAQLMQVPNVLFWVADEETRILTPVGFSDPAVAERFPVTTLGFGEGLVGWVAAHRQPLNLRDVFADRRLERPDIWRAEGMRAFHGIPVVFEGALLGVLALVGREPIGLATPVQALLEGLVAQAAVAIRNASLYEAEGRARREAELALAQVKQLQGMLPICAYCKKVRNDRNYWEQIETYIGERSQATFSHGICPDCRESIVKPQLEQWKAEQRQQRGG